MQTRDLFFASKSKNFGLLGLAWGILYLQGCAPWYYYPPPPNSQNPYSQPYSQTYSQSQPYTQPQPQVVVVKSCECPPQGIGFVRINSAPPFASVYVNGKPEGETPMEYLSIPAGQAHIEVIHRQFGPADTVIEVRPGQKIDIKMHLNQAEASLP